MLIRNGKHFLALVKRQTSSAQNLHISVVSNIQGSPWGKIVLSSFDISQGKDNAATKKKAPSAYSALHVPGTGTDHAPGLAMGSAWQKGTGVDAPCESNSQAMFE